MSDVELFVGKLDQALLDVEGFTLRIVRAAALLTPTITVRQLLIFLKFARADLKGIPISLSQLKDDVDAPDNFGGSLFSKTTSAAFSIFFENGPRDLGWLYKFTYPHDARIVWFRLTPKGRAALSNIMGEEWMSLDEIETVYNRVWPD